MNDKDFHRQLKEFKVFNKAMAALRGSSFASSRKVYSEYEGVDYQNYDEMNNNRKARNKFFTAPSKILSQKKM